MEIVQNSSAIFNISELIFKANLAREDCLVFYAFVRLAEAKFLYETDILVFPQ